VFSLLYSKCLFDLQILSWRPWDQLSHANVETAVKTVVYAFVLYICVCNSEVKKLTQLEELNVSGNHLTTLPTSLGHLTKLAILRVHSNSLHSLLNFHDAVSLRVSSDCMFNKPSVDTVSWRQECMSVFFFKNLLPSVSLRLLYWCNVDMYI